ncbi:MAG: hypothetical protein J1E63_03825 [Muribaculaceae bacterium]|nr:hypothetical protein [Muribaculaceae bacterium]
MKTRNRGNNRFNGWLVAGALILIALLLIWLTWADLLGDTDVAAMINPISLLTL